jgi:hypothetical protein
MSGMYMRIPSAAIGLACLSAATGVAAHPRETLPSHPAAHGSGRQVKVAATSDDGSPRVRIRGERSGKGLSPQAFSRWLNRHPALVRQQRASSFLHVLASANPPIRNIATSFDIADANRDGRVFADELADFLTRVAPPRLPGDAT